MRNRFMLMLLITLPSVILDQWSKILATRWALKTVEASGMPLVDATGQALTGLPRAIALANNPQIYKSYLNGFFELDYAINLGAWGGLGDALGEPWRTILLTYLVGLFLLGLAVYIVKQKESPWMTVALSCILAGGIGNFIDRAAYGYVVDFLVMGYAPLRTNIFNIADVVIMIGAGVLLVYYLKESFGDRSKPKPVVKADAEAPVSETNV